MKKLIIVLCILFLITGCKKKPEPLDPIDPIEPPVVDPTPDPTPEPEPDPIVDKGLSQEELWQYLKRYDHFENEQQWDGFISFSSNGGYAVKKGLLTGKKVKTGTVTSVEYNLDNLYEIDVEFDADRTTSILVRFNADEPAKITLTIDGETYTLKASNSEIPQDVGLSAEELFRDLSAYANYESEEGFFAQFINGDQLEYIEGMWSSGYMVDGYVQNVEYKGNDIYNITVYYEEVEEGTENAGQEAHTDVVVLTFDPNDSSEITIFSNGTEYKLTGKINFDFESVWAVLCGYESFNAEDMEYAGQYVSFETEAGSCYMVEGDVTSGSYDRGLLLQYVPTPDGCIIYLSFETADGNIEKRYSLTYDVQQPEKLAIQFPDHRVTYIGQ
ncbi:MAG: hypothetical protein IJM15_03910 [Erysipelotrichaceae bacterium]|nr:hypothetical protein [Erysipelotrichaceae bacterium]